MRITKLKVENIGKLRDFELSIGAGENVVALVQEYGDEIPFEPTDEELIFRYLFDCWADDEFSDEAFSLDSQIESICQLETGEDFLVCITEDAEKVTALTPAPNEKEKALQTSRQRVLYPFKYSENAVYSPCCQEVFNGISDLVEGYLEECQNLLEPYNARAAQTQAAEVLTAIDSFIQECPALRVNDSLALRLDGTGRFVGAGRDCCEWELTKKEIYFVDLYGFLLKLQLQKRLRELLGEERTYPVVFLNVFVYLEKEKWGFFLDEVRKLGAQAFILSYGSYAEMEKDCDKTFVLSRK